MQAAGAAAAAFKRALSGGVEKTLAGGKADNTRNFVVPHVGADFTLNQTLTHHFKMADGLAQVASDFLHNLKQMITMVDGLLEVARTVDPKFLGDVSHMECKAHIWALAMGVKATAPHVGEEVKRRFQKLENIRTETKTAQMGLENKGRAQYARNHYLLKLQVLKTEQAEREEQGRKHTAEQLQRLARTEAKLAKAEQELDRCAEVVGSYKDQVQQNKATLGESLNALAQAFSCAWFVSTGAVVCQALNQAENSGRQATAPPPAESNMRVLVLPSGFSAAQFEPSGRFDAEDPFGRGNLDTQEETSSPLHEDSPNHKALYNNELEKYTVRQLRTLLQERGLSDKGCIEKSDMIARLRNSIKTGIGYSSFQDSDDSHQSSEDESQVTAAVSQLTPEMSAPSMGPFSEGATTTTNHCLDGAPKDEKLLGTGACGDAQAQRSDQPLSIGETQPKNSGSLPSTASQAGTKISLPTRALGPQCDNTHMPPTKSWPSGYPEVNESAWPQSPDSTSPPLDSRATLSDFAELATQDGIEPSSLLSEGRPNLEGSRENGAGARTPKDAIPVVDVAPSDQLKSKFEAVE